jgi:hypothetical protein
MRRLPALALICCISMLAGCASFEPVPKGYTGPTATVRDSGFSEDGTKAQLFALMEVDGNRVGNAFAASANASYGRGASLTTVYPSRQVQVKPMKVLLRASHATGAPIHAMASQMAGTFFSVEGSVDFTPKADGRYVVKGELNKERSSVWIEDEATGQAVTGRVTK